MRVDEEHVDARALGRLFRAGTGPRPFRRPYYHATPCIPSNGFLLAQRLAAQKTLIHPIFGEVPTLPDGFRTRGFHVPRRHVPDSIATLRKLAAAMITILNRCPCCGRNGHVLLTQQELEG
jgi:hypothetical protein